MNQPDENQEAMSRGTAEDKLAGLRPVGIGAGVICGAKTKSGGICTQPAQANGRCRKHGGNAASGLRAGNFRHGRYTMAVDKMNAEIEDRINDPALVDPRRSIAVQEQVLARFLEMAENGDSPDFRERVKQMLGESLSMMKSDPAEALAILRRTKQYVDTGVEAVRALKAVKEAGEGLNFAQSRYWQLALSAARAISPEEFIQFMFAIADIIEGELGDKDAARRILERADREICGGSLGIGRSKTAQPPRDQTG